MTLPLDPHAAPATSPADAHDCGHAAAASRQPLPASRKVRVQGVRPGVSVPMREIALTNGEKVTVYDTSGPYTDPTALIDSAISRIGTLTPGCRPCTRTLREAGTSPS